MNAVMDLPTWSPIPAAEQGDDLAMNRPNRRRRSRHRPGTFPGEGPVDDYRGDDDENDNDDDDGTDLSEASCLSLMSASSIFPPMGDDPDGDNGKGDVLFDDDLDDVGLGGGLTPLQHPQQQPQHPLPGQTFDERYVIACEHERGLGELMAIPKGGWDALAGWRSGSGGGGPMSPPPFQHTPTQYDEERGRQPNRSVWTATTATQYPVGVPAANAFTTTNAAAAAVAAATATATAATTIKTWSSSIVSSSSNVSNSNLSLPSSVPDETIFGSTGGSSAHGSAITNTINTKTTKAIITRLPSKNELVVNPKDVDELLSNELRNLTFQERAQIQEEIHGVATACPPETDDVVITALHQLQKELEAIPIQDKQAYLEAMESPISYVHRPSFRLRFLRCELFDAKQAAGRLVRYLQLTKDTFGTDAIIGAKTVTHSMLGVQEQKALQSGHIQWLRVRDRSGRAIIVSVFYYALHIPYSIRTKVHQYLFSKATEDIETQRNGVVLVYWGFGPDKNLDFPRPDKREHLDGKRMMEAVPMRVSAMHFCFQDSPRIRLLKAVATLMVGGKARTRLTFHAGNSSWDVRYRLMGYGIPVDLLPVTETGKLKTKQWAAWIKLQKWLEESPMIHATYPSLSSSQMQQGLLHQEQDHATVIQCPFLNDVVFRNGTSSLSNPGNAMFRGLVETYFPQHILARTNDEKVAVSWKIMELVEARGGRFLEWHKEGVGASAIGWWKVINNRNVARGKVAICLRDFKKMVQARKNLQTTACSTYAFQRQDGRKRTRMLCDGKDDSSDEQSQPCGCIF